MLQSCSAQLLHQVACLPSLSGAVTRICFVHCACDAACAYLCCLLRLTLRVESFCACIGSDSLMSSVVHCVVVVTSDPVYSHHVSKPNSYIIACLLQLLYTTCSAMWPHGHFQAASRCCQSQQCKQGYATGKCLSACICHDD